MPIIKKPETFDGLLVQHIREKRKIFFVHRFFSCENNYLSHIFNCIGEKHGVYMLEELKTVNYDIYGYAHATENVSVIKTVTDHGIDVVLQNISMEELYCVVMQNFKPQELFEFSVFFYPTIDFQSDIEMYRAMLSLVRKGCDVFFRGVNDGKHCQEQIFHAVDWRF